MCYFGQLNKTHDFSTRQRFEVTANISESILLEAAVSTYCKFISFVTVYSRLFVHVSKLYKITLSLLNFWNELIHLSIWPVIIGRGGNWRNADWIASRELSVMYTGCKGDHNSR